MNCSVKHSTTSFSSSNQLPRKGSLFSSKIQSLPAKLTPFDLNIINRYSISLQKPLFVSHLQDFGGSTRKLNQHSDGSTRKFQDFGGSTGKFQDFGGSTRKLNHLQAFCGSTQKFQNFCGSGRKLNHLQDFGGSGRKPTHGIVCKAYEADHSQPLEIKMEEMGQTEAGQKMKIGLYFATWWSLNVVFNIYNKKVLNVFPFPWLTSTLSLAAGSLIMLVSWATKMVEAPNTDVEFWKSLFPVALAHTIGHVAATISMSKVAVSFTHIIKSGEPAFSVFVSSIFLGETFPLGVYLSLLPIIGGCALSALTELNFNMTGFMGAMISNLAFVFRNIFSKKGMKGKSVSGMNYYACLSMLSLLILTPFTIAMEGPQIWEAGWQTALTQVGPNIIWWMVAQSVFYHLYNQVSYMSLDQISPLTFSVGNTMKRISVIVTSIIIFRTPIQPINALGAAIAILGTFIYSQAKQ